MLVLHTFIDYVATFSLDYFQKRIFRLSTRMSYVLCEGEFTEFGKSVAMGRKVLRKALDATWFE